jgi:hypothetical protein
MSRQGVDEAIERICSDEQFALAVLGDGEAAFGDAELTPEERTEIVEALRADIDDITGDVQGFIVMPSGHPLANVALPSLTQFAVAGGTFQRGSQLTFTAG